MNPIENLKDLIIYQSRNNEIVAPLVRQISWTHNVMILGATNSIEEKEFYIKAKIVICR